MNCLRVSFLAAVCLALAGCGSSGASPANTPTAAATLPRLQVYDAAAAHLPACAGAGRAVALPAHFPAQFPFPRGTAITSSGPLSFGVKGVGIHGFVPSTSFAVTVNFFKMEVPHTGFKLLHFEVDTPHDSEGTYSGYGRVGVWQLRAIAGCPGAMRFDASSEPPAANPALHQKP